MVISASAIPPAMPARPPDAPGGHGSNASTIPMVVPSRPTNGAVEPTVARMPRPRLKSESSMQHLPLDRPLGRVDVGRGDGGPVAEQGLHFRSAPPSTRATWLRLVLLGQRDGLVELLFLDGAGELRRELPGRPGALVKCQSLLNAMVKRIRTT